MAGGGIRGGQVVGASDRHAAYPADRPVTPQEVLATIDHCLGIDRREFSRADDGQIRRHSPRMRSRFESCL